MAGAVVFFALAAGARAPTAPATPDSTPAATPAAAPAAAPTWSLGSVDFSGFLDGYYSYNANRPGQNSAFGQTNQLYNFNDQANQFSLEAAKITINHDADPVGVHVDLMFGRTNAFLHGADSATANYLEQAFISVKPAKAKGFEMDFGQFVTSAGQEVIETMNNWSYSHGILFGYAIPYYHFRGAHFDAGDQELDSRLPTGKWLEQCDRQQRWRDHRADQLPGEAEVHVEHQLLHRPGEL